MRLHFPCSFLKTFISLRGTTFQFQEEEKISWLVRVKVTVPPSRKILEQYPRCYFGLFSVCRSVLRLRSSLRSHVQSIALSSPALALYPENETTLLGRLRHRKYIYLIERKKKCCQRSNKGRRAKGRGRYQTFRSALRIVLL